MPGIFTLAAMEETAFAVLVPEAEPYVRHLRERYDPSAALGAAAHITILYPFMPPAMITAEVLAEIGAVLAASRSFGFGLQRIARFPGVLYLEPEPAEPLVTLTKALASRFPLYPPYGGRHADIRPHLTIAQSNEEQLAAAERELHAIFPVEGVACRCSELVLMENSSGKWRQMRSFALQEAR